MKPILTALFFCLAQRFYAQDLASIQSERKPLVLQSLGSFYLGGEKQLQNPTELGGFSSEGHVTVNQMYVQYMVPQQRTDSLSFVLIHGMNLSGKTWETTPDGRMGWNEYFVRKGYPVYVVDQVGAGRSGFNQKFYNLVRAEQLTAGDQAAFQRISDENTWLNFRFGQTPQQPVAAAKYPVGAVHEFSKQSIPFALFGLADPNPNHAALSTLATALRSTVLVSHSQSGRFPLEAALLHPDGVKAMVVLEPGGTGADFTEAQLRALASIPLLVVFGDSLENETGIPGHSWKAYYDGWSEVVQRLKAVGGQARMLYLPDLGIRGNSHMLMQDQNHQQIADLILTWLAESQHHSRNASPKK
ncbi:hypothetical protein SAMN05421823_1274 [Catalinimonas alkaloidigena]|uniref:Alpha/beta hydrolase family protein n=1 Tax=Catalinimonas alkaloidigena TaxID=1075417 RepID=A0A1G9VZ94_9BACT|nr:hypothetical protein [Catalinimonas alkaloidigena]SDM77095.1 hypothetical protein SAMN05421823_1274 [Catalinimonas alkaloidigena]